MRALFFSSRFEHLLFSLIGQELCTERPLQYCLAFTLGVECLSAADEQGVLSHLGGLSQVVAAAWNSADE